MISNIFRRLYFILILILEWSRLRLKYIQMCKTRELRKGLKFNLVFCVN